MLHSAWIGLGSNLGQSRELLQQAWQALGKRDQIMAATISSPYRTRPVGMDSQHWFINAVGLLQTSLTANELLDTLIEIEQEFGRTRTKEEGYQDRTLDLDLLLYDDLRQNSKRLTLPHPRMHQRLFVLEPLNEISPQLLHPVLDKTMSCLNMERLASTTEPEEVSRLQWKQET